MIAGFCNVKYYNDVNFESINYQEEEEKEFEAREVAAKIERRGRRNVAMEKEVSMVTVPNPSNKKPPDNEMAEVTCKQPSSDVEMMRGGLINEGFDDSLKY